MSASIGGWAVVSLLLFAVAFPRSALAEGESCPSLEGALISCATYAADSRATFEALGYTYTVTRACSPNGVTNDGRVKVRYEAEAYLDEQHQSDIEFNQLATCALDCAAQGGHWTGTGTCETCNVGEWAPETGQCVYCFPPFVLVGGQCEEPVCIDGQYPDGSQCEMTCPEGQSPDIFGGCVDDPPECPPGQHENESGVCATDDCTPPQIRELGQCIDPPTCPEGQHYSGGYCTDDDSDGDCPPGMHSWNGVCLLDDQCPPGTYQVNGQCIDAAECPVGTNRNWVTGECDIDDPPDCPPFTHAVGSVCRADDPPECGPGQYEYEYMCIDNPDQGCPAGTVQDGGVCVEPPPSTTCPEGEHNDGSGSCAPDPPPECGSGQEFDGSAGTCVDMPPATCAEGEHSSDGECVGDNPEPEPEPDDGEDDGSMPPSTCAPGEHVYDGACVVDPDCPPGFVLQGNACVPGGSGPPGGGGDPGEPQPDEEEDDGHYSGGSTCGAPPMCSGDAPTCGVVMQIWLQRCQGVGDLPQLPAFDVDALDGGEVDVAGDGFDMGGLGLSDACPYTTPMVVTVMGSDVTVDWSMLCDFGVALRSFILLGAGFVGVRIVAKSA